MESKLQNWINNQVGEGSTISEILLRTIAIRIMKEMSVQVGVEMKFTASPRWLRNFCNRSKVKSVSRMGESLMVDDDKVNNFVQEFEKMIENEGYSAEQIFNCDETGFFLKETKSNIYDS